MSTGRPGSRVTTIHLASLTARPALPRYLYNLVFFPKILGSRTLYDLCTYLAINSRKGRLWVGVVNGCHVC
jgi:hypothetical protein